MALKEKDVEENGNIRNSRLFQKTRKQKPSVFDFDAVVSQCQELLKELNHGTAQLMSAVVALGTQPDGAKFRANLATTYSELIEKAARARTLIFYLAADAHREQQDRQAQHISKLTARLVNNADMLLRIAHTGTLVTSVFCIFDFSDEMRPSLDRRFVGTGLLDWPVQERVAEGLPSTQVCYDYTQPLFLDSTDIQAISIDLEKRIHVNFWDLTPDEEVYIVQPEADDVTSYGGEYVEVGPVRSSRRRRRLIILVSVVLSVIAGLVAIVVPSVLLTRK